MTKIMADRHSIPIVLPPFSDISCTYAGLKCGIESYDVFVFKRGWCDSPCVFHCYSLQEDGHFGVRHLG